MKLKNASPLLELRNIVSENCEISLTTDLEVCLNRRISHVEYF